MTTERIDVLAVMEADALHAQAYRVAHGLVDSTPAAMRTESDEARAAVAELIEADKAYDAAIVAEADAEASGDDDLICASVRQLQWAKDRRASALARVGAA